MLRLLQFNDSSGEKESEKENSKDAEKDEEKEKDEERKLSTPHAFSKIKKDHPHGHKHCYRVLCEHEQGWHVAGDPIPAPNMNDTFLHKLIPYLARIMAIVKHSKHITLNCISGEEGEQFLKWLEETPRNAVSEWQDVYRDLLQEVLKADKDSTMAGLARCHLPSGKVAWLCEGHRSQGRITVLSSTGSSAVSAPDAGKENFMLKALMAPDNQLTLKYKAHNETQMAAAMKDKKKAETTQKPKSGKTARPSETGPPSVNPLVAATANAMTLDAVQRTAATGNNSQRTKARFKAAGIVAAVAGQKRNSSQTCVIL
ncbi:uncharacterized protein LOC106164382 [Lingula anatina]|uniref:Uncharacterized protein LOC106164382 n=1 Tax=Lingula anatina TaxID=7574 RepID=A0A1S3IHJ2_LINAN|nr:uncharacterized protein LOC106164382 [Lingula anatina]|eukprot:XP_013397730.1 uncharacterized protein LOC106164382 [Lingula anatina]